MAEFDLALVMPVYNEQECIAEVVRSWKTVLSRLGIPYQLIVLNDGSKDHTAEQLAAFAGDPAVVVVNKKNSGHGPTILEGYRMAVERAEWVFQCDSDDEMRAEHFPKLWNSRQQYDALFGIRSGREQNAGRKLISAVSRMTVRTLFGKGVQDVNTPYRLMRAPLLKQVVAQIPADTFAPNVIISGAFAKAGLRLCNLPVPHEGRRTGSVSIVKWKLWKAAFRSFRQTLRCRPTIVISDSPDQLGRRAA
jgi:glycosyltransferase involved in cell wall biosynthesis